MYIDELSVTGLTSNPTIFVRRSKQCDLWQRKCSTSFGGKSREALFFELALDDLTRAGDLCRPIHDRTSGVDGWVSL
jgi:transaldolase